MPATVSTKFNSVNMVQVLLHSGRFFYSTNTKIRHKAEESAAKVAKAAEGKRKRGELKEVRRGQRGFSAYGSG